MPQEDEILNKKLTVEEINVALLEKNPWNSNVMTPENEAKLEESIRRVGAFKPITARRIEGSSKLQILGGEHRWQLAVKRGDKTIDVTVLDVMPDDVAKEISLVDNARYGVDDGLKLSEVLESLGDAQDISSFMPYSESELDIFYSSSSIDLDSLDLIEEDDIAEELPVTEKPSQAHRIMRFKVPVEDAHIIEKAIEKAIQENGFVDSDSLTNAGDALVHLMREG